MNVYFLLINVLSESTVFRYTRIAYSIQLLALLFHKRVLTYNCDEHPNSIYSLLQSQVHISKSLKQEVLSQFDN